MGHNAFETGYRKPNIKLHVIIFLTIVGVSVFLSTQVEKTKNNVGVEALKTPVPIDSVFVEESKQDTHVAEMTITPPVIKEPDAEYHFDSGPNLAAIDQMLAMQDEPSISTDVSPGLVESSSTSSPDEPASSVENASAMQQAQQKEKDIAIMVTEDPVQDSVAPVPTTAVAVASKEEVVASVPEVKEQKAEIPVKKIGKMDSVYELQQDRFLKTLAKTASSQSEETAEVKRMKEAMRSDSPIKIKSDVKSSAEDKMVVKVATANTTGSTNLSSENARKNQSLKTTKTVVAKATVPNRSEKIQRLTKTAQNELLLTKGELNNVLSQFARSYNKGDIHRLMALFDDNAVTNDQVNKNGIKAEYAELFSNTSVRNIKIKNIQWDLGKGKARGDAKFTVTVKPLGSTEIAQIEGKLEILAVKESRGVFIKSLLHQVNAQ